VTATCTPASGSTFPLGTTTVTCTATDALGRSAVCPTPTSVVVKSHTLGLSSIVAFGDSITAGENGLPGQPTFQAPPTCPSTASTGARLLGSARPQFIDTANSYPALLRGSLNADFMQTITVDNRGWPGETAAQGVPRLQCVLGVDHPDTLLLVEGINDLVGAAFTPTSMQQVTADLLADIQTAHAAGVSLIFVGTLLPNGTCTMSTCRGSASNNQLIAEADTQIGAMVAGQAALGATLVDVYAAYTAADSPTFTTLIDTDGLHPAADGNALTAKTFLSALIAKAPVLSVRRGHR
jgi:lysophospholipase L1-like esterase